ncbi:HNH endonuclease [Methanobrevibacter sp.]|uniref:HNH endonuclease n=1 Tax=Methanobrevibacter sp. TaxID=66852 RepID=UPI0025E91258|nr:HNH endonuclease [Methanobrevibacter sp.]MBQ2832395.1 HNH endonuclease [Methanobrevibacter sp.]
MSDTFIIDEFGNCTNKFKATKKYGKHEVYCLEDTMNSKLPLFRTEDFERELNYYVNMYVNEAQKNDELTAILNDLNIDEHYYWDNKPKNDSQMITNVPVHFTIYDSIEFAIMEMVCTLKNLNGEYTYCKGRIRKIYGAILDYITSGGIKVKSNDSFHNFKCKIIFSEEWERLDVPKTWEKNPLHDNAIFNNKVHSKKVKPKRKPISGVVRQNVFMRDNYTCQICGKTIDDGVSLHLDHIKPVSKGGTNEESNLQCLCSQCNLEKHNRTDLKHDENKLKELRG